MKWASAIAQSARLEDALDESLESLAADLGGEAPDLVIAFTSPDYGPHLTRLAPVVSERYPGVAVLGCSADGIIGGGRELEHTRGLVMVGAVLPGVDITTFHLGQEPAEWREHLDLVRTGDPAFLVLTDPYSCPSEDLVRWLDSRFPGSVTVGGVASGGRTPGTVSLLSGSTVMHSGAVGVALSGNIEVQSVVAQGCRPIGVPMFATRVAGNLIIELDGRPALEALETLYTLLPAEDKPLFRHSLFIGLVTDQGKQEYHQGDFLIRNIVGVEPDMGAIMVAAEVSEHLVVQFHLRDAETSAADLDAMLERYQGPAPAGALLFSCLGRGMGLYGHPDHDSLRLAEHFGPVPIGGFFGNGEIGPVSGQTFVHGYTSCFALFGPRRG